MAEAIVETIPCERCNTQINLEDWTGHIRTCFYDENNRIRGEKRSTIDDDDDGLEIARIPCEFCDNLINADDWRSHSKTCADAHRNRIENLKRGVDNEPMDVLIPCEYCDTPVSVHDLEWHTRQCADSRRPSSRKLPNDEPVLIPCENCNTSISAQEWEQHTRQCAGDYRRNNQILKKDETALIPCEYCNVPFNIHELEWHTRQCADSQRPTSSKKSSNDGPVLIPCENCNTSVSAEEWERHTRQCNGDYRRNTQILKNDKPALIPCEYCNAPVSILELESHTNQCAQAGSRRISNIAKRIPTKQSDGLVPCEYCNKPISLKRLDIHKKKCRRKQTESAVQPDTSHDLVFENNFNLPEYWDGSPSKNLTRHQLITRSEEYKFVADNFHKTLPSNRIVHIDRIQNRRWYRQYDAHKEDFIERYNKSTEQWLFHGCRRPESAEAIIADCFNRSHAVNCAVGQGIYFATQSAISHGYTQPDKKGYRYMFMARVLVGKTTQGNASTRVCPPGFDTTGGGDVFVTYHDAQAYGQYLIVYK